jgi:hypothetical protein
MYTNQRNISRVLAAAVASAGFAVAPMPAFGTVMSCAGGSFSVSPDGQGNFNVNCASPGGTPTCTLSASPSSLPATGGTVTLTASNCGTISGWTKAGTTVNQTVSTLQDSIPANAGPGTQSFTYTVNGSTSASVTVTEAAPGTTNPPPDGPTSCDGYTVIPVDLPFKSQSSVITKGFNNSTMVVARITTPATGVVTTSASVASGEFGDGKATRTASLSTSPCDLKGTGVGRAGVFPGNTQAPGFTYQINGTVSILSSRVVLQPSTTYYFNIVNRDSSGAPSCHTSSCNMIIQMTVPSGF